MPRRRSQRVGAAACFVALVGATVLGALLSPSRQRADSIIVPVLLYHRIDDAGGHLSISPAAFDAQMAWLAEQGYTAITARDLAAALDGSAPLPPRPVMITVDDGYHSALLFTSIVRTHGFHAVYFWPNWAELTPAEMRDIATDGEICGHTVDHADLTTLTMAQQAREILDNQRWLQARTGQAVDCFAYPMGRSNATSTAVLEDAHFAFAFDASGPEATLATLDRFHIARVAINHEVSLAAFIALMTNGY